MQTKPCCFFARRQNITIGIITEILMRIYFESQQKRPFSIKDVYIGGKKLDSGQ